MSRVIIKNAAKFREDVRLIREVLAYHQKISLKEAEALILEQLGLSTHSTPTKFEVWTQPSRLKCVNSVDEQHFSSLAWLGFRLFNCSDDWLKGFLATVDIEFEQPLQHLSNRSLLRHFFRKARLDAVPPSERELEEVLTALFKSHNHSIIIHSQAITQHDSEFGFQINCIYTDADNHLYMELCGTTKVPLIFVVQNERTGYTWQALGSRLTGNCKPYRAIWDISSANTWYAVEVICQGTDYGAYVRCFTSAVRPYFCADVRIEPPQHNYVRRIDLPPQ